MFFAATLLACYHVVTFYGHYTRQPAALVKHKRILLVQSFTARVPLNDDGNQHIRIREKTLEFSAVLYTLSPYFR